jgi:hypothetical protein
MQEGSKGMGSKKHAQSGHPTQSPKFRFMKKLEAEKNEIKDRSRIKDPKSSVQELFKKPR